MTPPRPDVNPARCWWDGKPADRFCPECGLPACGGREAPQSHSCDGPPAGGR